jgi:ligand-binding sensor domain-containing protein/signal transduction histidine kinase
MNVKILYINPKMVVSITLFILGALAGLMPACQADAREPPAIAFEHVTIASGVSYGFDVLQDQLGFLWIGTKSGLFRYDGYEFTAYTHDITNPNSLSDNFAWKILEDRNGILWISTWGGGLNRFDPAQNRFLHYRYNDDDPASLSNDNVYYTFQDQAGTLWIGTENGLNRLNPDQNAFIRYYSEPDNPKSLSHSSITLIDEDPKGMLWIGTYEGLNRFNPATGSVRRDGQAWELVDDLNEGFIWSVYTNAAGTVWVGTYKGLYAIDLATDEVHHYQHDPDDPQSLSHNTVDAIYEDRQGRLWVGTFGGGLNLFDPAKQQFSRYQHKKENPNSLVEDHVQWITEDRAGALWVITDAGLDKYDPGGKKFTLHRNAPENPNSLSANHVTGFYEDEQGILWIGTGGGGLNRFDRSRNTFTHYLHTPENPQSLSNNTILRILPGRDGVLWIATRNGLNAFDPDTGDVVRYFHEPENPNSLQTNLVQDAGMDADGNLWLSVFGAGMDRFDPQRNQFTHYQHDSANPNSLATAWILAIMPTSDGMIWAGGDGGLSRFNPATGTFTNYAQSTANLSSSAITVIFEDSRGRLWVGTNNGLNRFDRATQSFTVYTEKDGLSGLQIMAMVEDDRGNLWITTNNGMSKYHSDLNTFRNYDQRDGLQGNQFSSFAAYKSRDGTIFVGGIKGFNTFSPDALVDNPFIPPVVFTDFQLLNQPVEIGGDSPLQKNINVTDHLVLPYDYTVLTLKFAALNYRSSKKNQYAYMLNGFDKDWARTDSTNRLATYTNLDPGEYTFRVKASNNDGVWNEEGTSLKITITPPWWGTWWFRILAGSIIVCLTFVGYRLRVSSIKRRSRELKHQVAERTAQLVAANKELESFAYSVSHDLRAPLRAISGFTAILARRHRASLNDEGQHYLDNILLAGERMAKLIEDLLAYSRLGRSGVRFTPVALSNMFMLLAEEFAERVKEIGATLEIADNMPTVIGDKTLLTQIFANLVDNALIYRRADVPAHVTVTAQTESKTVSICVRDNGIGISPEHHEKIFDIFQRLHSNEDYPGTGIGLSTVKKSVKMLGGQLRVESKVGQGSAFFIELAKE